MEGLAEETENCQPESVNERRNVVEQSTTPLNGSMEGLAEETDNFQLESVNERRNGG
jgi:hypothetical protein